MGKGPTSQFLGRPQGICLTCSRKFAGPGDRCQNCAQLLRKRRKRKPR